MSESERPLDWRKVNLRLWTYYVICFVALWTPGYQLWGKDVRVIVCALLGSIYNPVVRSIGSIIREYQPFSIVDAKRTNEQIKSTAGMLNTFATASVTIFALSELRAGFEEADLALIMVALGFALYIHSGARRLLGFLKDEAAPVRSSDTSVVAAQA